MNISSGQNCLTKQKKTFEYIVPPPPPPLKRGQNKKIIVMFETFDMLSLRWGIFGLKPKKPSVRSISNHQKPWGDDLFTRVRMIISGLGSNLMIWISNWNYKCLLKFQLDKNCFVSLVLSISCRRNSIKAWSPRSTFRETPATRMLL